MTNIVPRPAATVTLVRDAPGGFEVLMVQRNHQSVFMPGVQVFPGGGVDKRDFSDDYASLVLDMNDAEASRILGIASGGMAYWIAAVRESFEEAGMLFACESNGEIVTLDGGERASRIHAYRRRVEGDGLTLSAMLREEGLRLPLTQMTYFSHWITPVGAPRRYDTRFFVAVAPPSQKPVPDNRETISHVWVRPDQALSDHKKGSFSLRTPTIHTLKLFAEHRETGALIKAMGEIGNIPVIEPRIAKSGRRVLPGDPEYELAGTDAGRGEFS